MQQDGQFLLMNRQEFKDWLFKNTFNRHIAKIQNHHTWSPNYASFNKKNHFSMVKSMDNYHRSIGFGGIAQHITTFPDGLICIGRSFEKIPTGIYGANTGALCIEHVGNFDHGGDVMADEHKKTIIFINAMLLIRFGLKADTNSIIYHHWFELSTGKRLDWGTPQSGYTKSCPGTNFFGGNTVKDCIKNFLPLVNAEIVKEVMGMFADQDKISGWAKDAVEKVAKLGLMNGDQNNNFNPQASLTREQFAVVLVNLLKMLGEI